MILDKKIICVLHIKYSLSWDRFPKHMKENDHKTEKKTGYWAQLKCQCALLKAVHFENQWQGGWAAGIHGIIGRRK